MKKIPKRIIDEARSIGNPNRLTGLSSGGYTFIYKDHTGFNPNSIQICIKNYVL